MGENYDFKEMVCIYSSTGPFRCFHFIVLTNCLLLNLCGNWRSWSALHICYRSCFDRFIINPKSFILGSLHSLNLPLCKRNQNFTAIFKNGLNIGIIISSKGICLFSHLAPNSLFIIKVYFPTFSSKALTYSEKFNMLSSTIHNANAFIET